MKSLRRYPLTLAAALAAFAAGCATTGVLKKSPVECHQICARVPDQTLLGMRVCVERCLGQAPAVPAGITPVAPPVPRFAPAPEATTAPAQTLELPPADDLLVKFISHENDGSIIFDSRGEVYRIFEQIPGSSFATTGRDRAEALLSSLNAAERSAGLQTGAWVMPTEEDLSNLKAICADEGRDLEACRCVWSGAAAYPRPSAEFFGVVSQVLRLNDPQPVQEMVTDSVCGVAFRRMNSYSR